MARGESPYQGRYVVPDVDFSGIERGGAAWGEAFKGIGSAIEQFQLNKQKRTVLEAGLQGKVEALMEHDPGAAEALLRDESFNKDTQRLATGEMKLSELEGLVGKIGGYSGQTQNIMRDKLAASQARVAQVGATIAERDDAQMSQYAKTLAGLRVKTATDTNEAEIKRILALAESAGLDRDILKRTVDDRVSILQSQAETAEAGADIAEAEAKTWEFYTPKERANYMKEYQALTLKLQERQVTAADYDNMAKIAPKDIAETMSYYAKLQRDLEAQKFNFKGKRYTILEYKALQQEHDPEGVGAYPDNGIPQRISGMLTHIEGQVDQALKSQKVQAITTPPGATDVQGAIKIGHRKIDIGELQVGEVPNAIASLKASKTALEKEKKGLRKIGATATQPIYSPWAGMGGSPRSQEIPMNINMITQREAEIDNEITTIDEQVIELEAIMAPQATPAP